MLIYVLDREPEGTAGTVQEAAASLPEARVRSFSHAAPALEAVSRGERPDLAFCAVELPEISGLEFAQRLKALSPDTRVVFAAEGDKYALEAFRVRAQGYLLKPLDLEEVKGELALVPPPERLRVRCFGQFEVFWRGEPLKFKRKQTKELLAYLIDRRGALCTMDEIAAVLYEEELDLPKVKHRIRNFLSDLRATLASIGMEGALLRGGGGTAVRKNLVDCDLYHMLEGDRSPRNAFRGEYMEQYSWAEATKGSLVFGAYKP